MPIQRILSLLLAAGGILFAVADLYGAEPGIEFTGYMTDERGLSVALRDSTSGYTKWILIGKEFEEYTVSRLDEKEEILIVAKGGKEFQLPLVRSKVKLGTGEPPAEIKRKVLNNLRQLAAAADQFYLENGVSRASYDDLVGATKYVKEVKPVDGEEYRPIRFEQGKALQTTTSQGYVISYLP